MNDSEKQKKSEKIVDFMNTGVMLLVVTAIVYLLFFAFNYGYNSYFDLPFYFSTMLPLRLISESPNIFFAIMMICILLMFVMPLRLIAKKILFNRVIIIASFLLMIVLDIFFLRDIWIIIFCVCSLIYCLWLFLYEKRLKNNGVIEQHFDLDEIKKELDLRQSLHDNGFVISDDWIVKTEKKFSAISNDFGKQQEKVERCINTFGGNSLIIDVASKISLLILLVFILFAVACLLGKYSAMKEESYLFVDDQTIVIDIYQNNYVSILVDYDEDENQYVQTGTYKLIPIDNAELRLQEKDGIKIVDSE